MDICRICRSVSPEKDLQQLKYRDKNGPADHLKILQFCLDIRFTEYDKITKKLCTKCFKKLLIFFKFKSMALENDAYFKSNGSFSSELVPQDRTIFEVAIDDGELTPKTNHIKGTQNETKTEVYYIEENLVIVPDNFNPFDNDSDDAQTEALMSDYEGESKSDVNEAETPENDILHNEPLKLEIEDTERKKKQKKSIKRCKTCNKAVADLHGHLIRVHHPELAKHVCKLCGARYRTPSSLHTHSCKLAKDLPKTFVCSLCDRKYFNEKLLKIHMSSVHRDKSYLCQYCSKVYSRHSYLIKHMRCHTKEKPFKCPTCEKCFSHSGALYRHKLLHQAEKAYHCLQCDKSYYNKCSLATHMENHKLVKDIPCRYCGELFYRYAQRHAHEHRVHRTLNTDDRKGKKSRSKTAKGESDANNDEIDDRQSFLCQLCPMTFERKTDLNFHLKHHGQERPHKCLQCDRTYLTNKGLEYHVQFAHTNTRQYQCELCARHFSSPRYLRQHMVSHNEGKVKLQCKYCKVGFVSQTACRHHEKKVHENKTVALMSDVENS